LNINNTIEAIGNLQHVDRDIIYLVFSNGNDEDFL